MPLFQGIDVAGFDTSQRHYLVVDNMLGGSIPKHFWAEGGSVAFLRDAVEDWTKEHVVSHWLVQLYLFQAVARAGYALIETLGCLRTAVVEVYAVQIVRACQLEMAVQHNAVVPFVWYFVEQLAACLSRIEERDRSQSRCDDKPRHRNTIGLLCMEALTKEQEDK